MKRLSYHAKVAASVLLIYAFLVACSTLREMRNPAPNRGVIANHAFHAQEGIDCIDCHDFSKGERASFPDHQLCSVCHEIPESNVADASCAMCHTRPDYGVWAKRVVLTEEIKFDHVVHNSADVSCAQCHENPDGAPIPAGRLKPLCMSCHEQPEHVFASVSQSGLGAQAFAGNDCAVCHREIGVETIPLFRHGERLAHDSPLVWEAVHGQESHADGQFCALCHDEQEDCAACHRITKPANHTAGWNRRIHGLQATWDRQSCAVCHEEDSCLKCHESSQPTSHRGSFDGPQSTHCVQCHFPPESNCAICHEDISHFSAPASPHDAGGGFPGNDCATCHPGGVSGAVPHLVNLTADCTYCHRRE